MITGYQELEKKVWGHRVLLVIDSDYTNKDQSDENYLTYLQICSRRGDDYASIQALRSDGGWDNGEEIDEQTLDRIEAWADHNGYNGEIAPNCDMYKLVQAAANKRWAVAKAKQS